LKEMKAARENGLTAFDHAFWSHIVFTISNAARATWTGITGARMLAAPACEETKRYYQLMTRFSTAFALLADVSMFVIGGSLKRKEKLSARLGDVLSNLYLMSCALKFYEDNGRQKDELPLLRWGLYDSAFKLQVAMDGIIANFPSRLVAFFLRVIVFPRGLTLIQPSDQMGHEVADLLIQPSAARSRLIAGIYLPKDEDDLIGKLEAAMHAVIAAEPVEAKVRTAKKAGRFSARVGAANAEAEFEEAVKLAVISETEHALWKRARALQHDIIMVDDFDKHFGKQIASEKTPENKWHAEAAE